MQLTNRVELVDHFGNRRPFHRYTVPALVEKRGRWSSARLSTNLTDRATAFFCLLSLPFGPAQGKAHAQI